LSQDADAFFVDLLGLLELERFKAMWLRAFQRLRSLPGAKPGLVRLGATTVLIALLLAPSIWMLSVIPPLWRDGDAYIQVIYPPGKATILNFSPLYCFVARIPLYLGYAIDCLRAGSPFPTPGFFLHPILSDSGVFILLLLQHLALGYSAFHLITLASRFFLVRLLLAAAWAANPLFYTFAHCVGAETLSMILLLLVAAAGLRIIRHPRSVPRKEWLVFGVLLWACILTRHINAVLAALIPLTFLLVSAQQLTMIPFTRSQLLRRWRRLRARLDLQKATLAFAVGIGCIVLASASLRGLCYTAQIPYHSTVGFTFLWRLQFLATLPPETRNQFLDKVAGRTSSPDLKKALSLLGETFSDARNWDYMPITFMQRAQPSLFTPKTEALMLNRIARAFLYPPDKIFLRAVATDFTRSREATIPNVVNYLFLTTTFYFWTPDFMAGCAPLSTFRDKSPAQIMAIFKKHSYFRRWKSFSYNAFLLFWCTNLSLLALLAKMRKEKVAAVASYATALTLVGLVMVLTNCFLCEFLPRFTLPMWELTIVSASVLLGRIMECLFFSRTPSV
jgi:hypothetical protein